METHQTDLRALGATALKHRPTRRIEHARAANTTTRRGITCCGGGIDCWAPTIGMLERNTHKFR